MHMTYIIRTFDPYSGMVLVEYDDLPIPVTLFLPIDVQGDVPVGEDLDTYITNNKPQPRPPSPPINNAADIEQIVQPLPPASATWDQIRATRNSLLADCDWTQLPDVNLSTELKGSWASYRQQLRDITEQFDDPGEVVWPTPPQA
jgi:hypothetical protein